ncbi:384_t:CDS:10 [Ambispora gerdemannii]|uniref:384_t:CDS:1 n=1 Tax=Ambispora gerdemannii TaxID=144530 RepID=A0A9N8YMW4_9GLOM|nr:384_t:CDS:10 [Ambispora gerdemannii]
MFDDLIKYCIDEIALDGEQGSNFFRLWSFVTEFIKLNYSQDSSSTHSDSETHEASSRAIPLPNIDDAFREYFWKLFVSTREVSFAKVSLNNEQSNEATSSKKKAPPKAPTLESIQVDNLTLQEVNSKYGNSLVMIAKPERQKHALYGSTDSSRQVTPQVYEILQLIARKRAQGETQSEIAKKLSIDPRSAFHYIRTLVNFKLIVKLPVVIQGTYTNLCILAKCAPDNQAYAGKSVYLPKESPIPESLNNGNNNSSNKDNSTETSIENLNEGVSYTSDLIRLRMTEILAQAKNKIMLATDLMKALGMHNPSVKQRRWFNRTIGTMHHQGFIEKVNVTQKGSNRLDRCVKLVKLYEKSKDKDASSKGKEIVQASSSSGINKSSEESSSQSLLKGLFPNLPLENQVYRLIELSGEKGIIPATLHRSLSNLNNRILYKILGRLSKPVQDKPLYLGVKRIAEFHGRERHYRYFTVDAFKKFEQNHGMTGENNQQESSTSTPSADQTGAEISDPLFADIKLLEDGQENKNQDFKIRKYKRKMTKNNNKEKSSSSLGIIENSQKETQISDPVIEPSGPPKEATLPQRKKRKSKSSEPSILKIQNDAFPPSSLETIETSIIFSEPVIESSDPPKETTTPPKRKRGRPRKNESSKPSSSKSQDNVISPSSLETIENSQETQTSIITSDLIIESSDPIIESSDPTVESSRKRHKNESSELSSQKGQDGVVSLPSLETIENSRQEIQTLVNTGEAIKKKKKQTQSSNLVQSINAHRRERIISQLLEEHKILECNHILIKQYQDVEAKELNATSLPHTIDKKTLIRTASIMEQKGLLRQYTVASLMLNGSNNTKLLFLHPSLTPSSPQVKQYIHTMDDKTIMHGGVFKPLKIEEEVEIETFEEMKKRVVAMETLFESTEEMSTPSSSNKLSSNGQQCAITINDELTEANQEHEFWWLNTAQDYGWINAKMIRAKLLHQFLFTKIEKASADDKRILKEKRIFQTVMLLRDLPLDLYLKLIGQTIASQQLSDYIQSGKDMSVNIIVLPVEIRTSIFSGNYKFRQNLKRLIDILVALDILKPISREFDEEGNSYFDSSNDAYKDNYSEGSNNTSGSTSSPHKSRFHVLHPAYQLSIHVPMLDYSISAPERKILREYVIESMDDVKRYWSELQFVAQQQASGKNDRNEMAQSDDEANHSSGEESQLESTSMSPSKNKVDKKKKNISSRNDKIDPLCSINNPRNWLVTYPLTAAQRKTLESYVDRKKGKTPLEDDLQCRQISNNINLPLQRVRMYFKRVEEAYESKNQNKIERKNLRMEKESRRKVAIKSIGVVATGKGAPYFRKKAEANPNRIRRGDEENLPIIPDEEERYQTQYETAMIRNRPNWTPKEDEILIHAYVILRIRSLKSRFFWAAATIVLPERSNEMCRRRINVLLKNAAKQDLINNLMARWKIIYKEGIRKGEIIDKDDVNMHNFDLPSQVEYFMKELANTTSIRDTITVIPLPRDIQQFRKLFDVTYSSQNREKDYFFEEQLSGMSLRARMKLLYSYSFTCRLDHRECFYEHPIVYEKSKIKFDLIEAVAKMILMTPDDQYDPAHAFTILNRYPEETVTEALEKYKQMGAIVKMKGSHSRRIPGRNFHVSDRFLSVMRGGLPDRLFTQAAAYSNSCKEEHEFSAFSDSGTMACLLDMIVHKKLSLSEATLPPFVNESVVLNRKSRNANLERLNFNVIIKPVGGQEPSSENNAMEITQESSASLAGNSNDPNLSGTRQMANRDTQTNKKRKFIEDLPNENHSKRVRRVDTDDDGNPNFLDEEKNQKLFAEFVAAQKDGTSKSCLNAIFHVISKFKDLGVTLLSLKEILHNNSVVISDTSLRHYLNMLEYNEPKLIRKVGYSMTRYICSCYATNWMIQIGNISQQLSSKNKTRKQSSSSPPYADPKEFAPPRMWYDINGSIIETVFRGCLEAVIGVILQKPGIYKSNIQRKLRLIMSRCEIEDCLEELLQRRIISERCILKPQKVSLFSKPREFKECDPDTIDSQKISTFTVNSGYYHYYKESMNEGIRDNRAQQR